jgi:hypothetical protein
VYDSLDYGAAIDEFSGGLVRRTNLILALALTTSGCFRYARVGDEALLPEPGSEVRLQLATPLELDLGSTTVHDVSRIEGDVYESIGDTLAVFSRRIFSAYGYKQYTNGAVFFFDRSQLSRLEQRKLMPVNTGIVAGAATAGVLAAIYFAADLGGGAEGSSSRDTPQNNRVVKIPFVWIIP